MNMTENLQQYLLRSMTGNPNNPWKIRKNETTKAQVESNNDANIPVDYLSAKIKDQSLGLNVDL